uniref:Aldehyde oxidase 1 n=1 Tax=Fundulus heteroclitus TaxID=8078 RepID=A0A3Q2PG74_FUNHE
GGCGACTVMVSRYQPATKTIAHYSANACLLPLCQLHGAAITTVEGIGSSKTRLHPVQERIAKAHGSQCGFCTPGMVMSMYALLRNKPQPTMEDITQALAGNLCRCTGYRPIVDGCRTFCQEANCCQANGGANCCLNGDENTNESGHFLPLDPTQELIFPPELILMAEASNPQTLTFHGERMTWVSPTSLEELVQLKAKHPKAPLVMGNTNIGPDIKFKGVLHPLIISPIRVKELFEVSQGPDGVWVGAGCSLSELHSLLEKMVPQHPEEKTELLRALIQQLGYLGSQQIRNVASLGGNVASAYPNSDLNPVLAAGNCRVRVVSGEVPLNQEFFVGFGKTVLRPDDVVVSVFIPFSTKGEYVRALRQAPRKEVSFATVTAGMRVRFSEGSRTVQEVSLYFGGMGPTTVSAAKTCQAVTGRPWNEETLNEAYDVLLGELALPLSAPGGKVEFRRSLTLSLLFKFYLDVLQKLRETVDRVSFLNARPPQPHPHVPKDQDDQDPVGRPMMHRSAVSQATGEAVYCDDLPQTDGELFLVLVTSSRAHAKITGLDVSEALKLPGVVDVITANDIPGKKTRVMFGYEQELFAEDEVFTQTSLENLDFRKNMNYKNFCLSVVCVGQTVCAVVADTKAHAKRGAYAVKITYEDLPDPIFTIEDAIEKSSYFEPRRVVAKGDVTEAFKSVDRVYEGQIRMGGQEHFYMETQSMLVVPVGEEREFKVYVSTQWPTLAQEAVAETLDIQSNRVTCHVKRLGGAFGGKVIVTSVLASITAVAAWKTNRAVRCVLERGEDMLITGGRHPVLGKYKVRQKTQLKDQYSKIVKKNFNCDNNWFGSCLLCGQVASRELHIPTSKVFISETSTSSVPNTCPSAASFGTDANGMAVKEACEILYRRLEPIRQKDPGGSWETWVREAHLQKISLSATGFFRGKDLYYDWDKMEGQPYAYFTFGACCSEVELDCLTGDYRTLRTDVVMDIGRSINPSVDIGQIEGAFTQGLGLYTLEELNYSPTGVLYSRGPSQYKIPAVCDVPLRFNVYLLPDSHNPHAIYSSKGIGEPTLFLGSSVFFAIKDAVTAARSDSGLSGPFTLDTPATPERAFLACASPFVKKVPASKPGSSKPWALNI